MLLEALYLVEIEPMPEAVFRELVGLGVYPGVGERMLEGRVDALDLEREPAAVARGIGEELLLIAAGGVGGEAYATLLVRGVDGPYDDVVRGDERLQGIHLAIRHAVDLVHVDQPELAET